VKSARQLVGHLSQYASLKYDKNSAQSLNF